MIRRTMFGDDRVEVMMEVQSAKVDRLIIIKLVAVQIQIFFPQKAGLSKYTNEKKKGSISRKETIIIFYLRLLPLPLVLVVMTGEEAGNQCNTAARYANPAEKRSVHAARAPIGVNSGFPLSL